MCSRRLLRMNRLAGPLAAILSVTASGASAFGAPTDDPSTANEPAPSAAPEASTPSAAPSQPQPATTPPAAPPAPTATPTAAPPPSVAAAAPAQQSSEACEDHGDDASEGEGEFFVGPGVFDFTALNDRLRAAGYEKLSTARTVLGGEGHGVFPSGFVVGARGGAVLGPSSAGPSGYDAKFTGGFGMVDVGYAFIHSAPMLLSLTAGFGGWGMGLDISNGQSAPFDAVLANPKSGAGMSKGGLLAGVTLSFDGRVTISEKRGRRAFMTIGARLSALYGPSLGSWDLAQGGEATSGPSFGLTGGFAALAIGFGGGRTHAP